MDIEAIRIVIKDQLKQQGMTYEEVASGLGVSVPTVKRWLTKTDIPFSGVDGILRLLNMNWNDFTKMIETGTAKRNHFSKKQEDFLSKNPKLAYLFLLLYQGVQLDQVKKSLKVDDDFLRTSYIKMEKAGLVNFFSLGRIKVLNRGPFKYKTTGPFAKRYFAIGAETILEHLLKSYWKLPMVPSFKPGKDLLKFGEIFLSEKSFELLKIELDELIEKYQEISRRESMTRKDTQAQPRVYMVGAGKLELWKSIMWGS